MKAAGLEDKIEIRLQDYREIDGQFDRITSVGMFEHVGRKNLPLYFSRIHDLLADDGIAMNHGITSTDAESGETALGGGEFIDRYVFPDGELPHISLALEAAQRRAEAIDVESLRRHYARTLDIWTENFEAKADAARQLVDDENSASGACISPAARMRSSTTTCRSSRSCAARPGRAQRRCRGRGAICTNTRCRAGGASRWACMGDGRTRRKAPPERQQHDDANTPHADGQFDLFGVPADAARASPENDGPPADTDEHVNPGAPDDAQPAPRPRTHARSSDETPPAASGLLWDEPSLPAEPPKKGRRRRGVLPAPITPDVADAAAGLPPNVRLGTSSWYFPGWDGIVYDGDFAQTKLARRPKRMARIRC